MVDSRGGCDQRPAGTRGHYGNPSQDLCEQHGAELKGATRTMKFTKLKLLVLVLTVALFLPVVAYAAGYRLSYAGGTIEISSAGAVKLTPKSGQGVVVGGGTALKKVLSGTGAVDFTALAAGSCETFTVTVTGAANGDSVALGIPAAAWATTEYATIEGFVSATDTVTVKRCNLTNATTALSNPASVTIRATVFQF